MVPLTLQECFRFLGQNERCCCLPVIVKPLLRAGRFVLSHFGLA